MSHGLIWAPCPKFVLPFLSQAQGQTILHLAPHVPGLLGSGGLNVTSLGTGPEPHRLTGVRDVIPVGGVELVLRLEDLFKELGVIFIIKRRVAAEPGREDEVRV